MKPRHTFRATGWDSLEGRALLSGTTAQPILYDASGIDQSMPMVTLSAGGAASAAAKAQRQAAAQAAAAARKQAAALRKAMRLGGRTGAPAVPQGPINTVGSVVKPNAAVGVKTASTLIIPPGAVGKPAVNTSTALPTPSYNMSTSSATLGMNNSGIDPGGGAYGRPGVSTYPVQTAAGTVVRSQPVSAYPLSSSPSWVGGLPVTPAVTPSTPNTPAAVTSTDPNATPGAPARPMIGVGLADALLMTKAESDTVKQAVDAFAGAYTSGTDTSADATARAALQAALGDVALGTWARTHVADAASVTALQSSVNGFAKSYTSGANPAADAAAWKSLEAGMGTFQASLKSPSATPPAPGGPGLAGVADAILQGPALTKDEVTSFKTAVDTFADAYTGGTDAVKDRTAVNNLQTSLGNLISARWAKAMPGGPLTSGAVTPAGTVSSVPALAASGMRMPLSFLGTRSANGGVYVVNPNGTPNTTA